MTTTSLARLAALLAAMWAGALACIAAIGAPSAFAVLARAEAARYAGRVFMQEAYLSLALALLLFAIERRRAHERAEAGRGSVLSAEIVLLLGTLFCTVAGYFALQPLMESARAGQGSWSFGALHAVSTVFFGIKGLLVLALAWRLAGAAREDAGGLTPSATS